MKVMVLGAGLTGMTTAWKLSEKGIDVEVIEVDKQVGGLAKSFKYKNFCFDYGPHLLEKCNERIVFEMKKLLGNDFTDVKEKKIKISFRNKKFDYPLRATNALFSLKLATIIRCASDYIFYNIRRKISNPKDDSFEDWLINRFGKRLYSIFFGPYTKKVWEIEPRELDSKFASERIPTIKLSKMITQRRSKPGNYQGYYPKRCVQEICDAMKAEIIKNGGRIHTNCKVKKISLEEDKIKSITLNNGEEHRDIDYLISTIPITELSRLTNQNKEVEKSRKKLRFRGITFMFMIIRKKKIIDEHWIYYQDGDVIFNRIYENKMFSELSAPEGRTGLALEFGEHMNLNDEKIMEDIKRHLKENNLAEEDEIEEFFIKKIPYAYPIYTKGYEKDLNMLKEELKKIKNLVSCGRQGMFRYLDMQHCIETGLLISDEIINKTYNFNKIEDIVARTGYEKT